MELTSHERDVITLVLRECADEMDSNAPIREASARDEEDRKYRRCRESAITAEMREIAYKVEWSL